VTTGSFSEPVQREVIDDEYPLLLVRGLRVAQVVHRLIQDSGSHFAKSFLDEVDAIYKRQVARQRPEEILRI